MAKLKLQNWSQAGDVLTSEDLKQVYGDAGSGSGSGSTPKKYCSFCVMKLENGYEMVIRCDALPKKNCSDACASRCIEYNKTATKGNKCKSIDITIEEC